MSKIHIWENGVTTEREATSTEQAEIDAREAEYNSSAKKLERIKIIRLKKLKETDWWVFRGNMSTAQTNYRQSLRDIPTDYEASKYDELLARDSDGKLTHSVWKQPTE
jgi:hypothetical protein|tara:strand:- start:945 stop:1268 length:324 start_codon:yes stop_codon:yes gene_type:complete